MKYPYVRHIGGFAYFLVGALILGALSVAPPTQADSETIYDPAGDTGEAHDITKVRFTLTDQRFVTTVTTLGPGEAVIHVSLDPGQLAIGGYFTVSTDFGYKPGTHRANLSYVAPGEEFGPPLGCRGAQVTRQAASVVLSAPIQCMEPKERVGSYGWVTSASILGDPVDVAPQDGEEQKWVRIHRSPADPVELVDPVEEPEVTDPCLAAWPYGTGSSRSIFGGVEENHDRIQSLYQVCAGFGMGTPREASNGMKCAIASAMVDLAGPPKAAAALSKACLWAGVAQSLADGAWASAVGSVGCAFFSDLVATGSGVLAAPATAATGPALSPSVSTSTRLFRSAWDWLAPGSSMGVHSISGTTTRPNTWPAWPST